MPIICDPLHLLKRMRYRLLQGKVFTAGFDSKAPTFDSIILKKMRLFANVPDVVGSYSTGDIDDEDDTPERTLPNEIWDADATDMDVLDKLKLRELRAIIAEMAAKMNERQQDIRIRSKRDAIRWIVCGDRWKIGRGIVRNWLEMQREIDIEREVEAEKEFRP